jgi:ABC-2 type transport system ATP-binding protein
MPTTLTPPPAELQAATKRFGATTALDGVDLTLEPGRLTALLGPNGAGKTTAVKLMLGLSRPSAGRARLFGGDPASRPSRQRTGALLQVAKVPETLKVREHVDLFRSYYPNPLPRAEVCRIAGLEGLEQRRFGELSGGQQRRVLFGLALCGDPEMLFLDEPTVGLDVEARRALWTEIRSLVRRGRSVLLTTHYLEEADALADRVVVIQHGRILADGSPSAIKHRVAGRRVRCVTRLELDELRGLPGVRLIRTDRDAVELLTEAAEPLVRELLARDPELSGLEVGQVGLEEAFLALTSNGASAAPKEAP